MKNLHEMALEAETGIHLTIVQRKMAELGIRVYLGLHSKPGWTGELPFYAWKCPIHGIVIDYPHGYYAPWKGTIPVDVDGVTSQLYCPLCEQESRAEATRRTRDGSPSGIAPMHTYQPASGLPTKSDEAHPDRRVALGSTEMCLDASTKLKEKEE